MRRFADRNMSRTAAAQMMFCASSCAACAAMMMNIALNLDASLLASILFVLLVLRLHILGVLVVVITISALRIMVSSPKKPESLAYRSLIQRSGLAQWRGRFFV